MFAAEGMDRGCLITAIFAATDKQQRQIKIENKKKFQYYYFRLSSRKS
jgi:hypothetical protein